MKKLILLLMIAAVFVSCKKNETSQVQPQEEIWTEVSFNVTAILPEATREYELPDCNDCVPSYAVIDITMLDGSTQTFYPPVFELPDGKLYTQAIRLSLPECPEWWNSSKNNIPGDACCESFTVTGFLLICDLDDANILPDLGDDVIVYAAPAPDSYAWLNWIDNPTHKLPLEFEVCPFEKLGYEIDVLCFQETHYDLFGFAWFQPNLVVVREACFFGDLCLQNFPEFTGEWAPYYNGEYDMVAVFKIFLEKFDPSTSTYVQYGDPLGYTNMDGVMNAPLCVPYADYLDTGEPMLDQYRANLWVYEPVDATTFDWVYKGFWSWDDNIYDIANSIDLNENEVIEFVVGDCNYYEDEVVLLPEK